LRIVVVAAAIALADECCLLLSASLCTTPRPAQFRPAGIQTFVVLVGTNAFLGGLVVWFLGRSDTNHVSALRRRTPAL
jgi:hypothetical protein